MRKNQVKIGETYSARVSGRRVPVEVLREYGISVGKFHYVVKNLNTGREVLKTARQLRKGGSIKPPIRVILNRGE